MRITIKRWGNSAGMVIPNIVMKELNLQPGQSVEAQVSNNQLILTPISRRHVFYLFPGTLSALRNE